MHLVLFFLKTMSSLEMYPILLHSVLCHHLVLCGSQNLWCVELRTEMRDKILTNGSKKAGGGAKGPTQSGSALHQHPRNDHMRGDFELEDMV